MEEITNPAIEEEYKKQKDTLIRLRGEDTVQELSLYHGTGENVANVIAEKGFDPTLNRTSMYGRGTYFAKNASYSKNYAPPSKGDEISFMLICSVLVGKMSVYGINKAIDTTIHDNSVDVLKNPEIYVTPYQYGAIPRYLVAFYKGV
jgi:hypothetical protein